MNRDVSAQRRDQLSRRRVLLGLGGAGMVGLVTPAVAAPGTATAGVPAKPLPTPLLNALNLRTPSAPAARIGTDRVTASAVPFDTGGWDTVFMVPLEDVNRAIKNRGSSPASWSIAIPETPFTRGAEGEGRFGDWFLVADGGSGQAVRLRMPFTGTVHNSGGSYEINDGTVHAEVHLEYLGDRPQQLVVRTRGTEDTPPVVVTKVEFSPVQQDEQIDQVKSLMQQWCDKHLAEFQHVFATVDVGARAATREFQWMQPTRTAYQYAQTAAGGGRLCVLAMTEERPYHGDGLVNGDGIPDGARAGFTISLERLMSKMVVPALAAEYPKAEAGTFVISGDKVESSTSFPMDGIKHAGITYHPKVQSLQLEFDGQQLTTTVKIHIPISPGIDAYVEFTSYTGIRLTTNDQGEQSLTWYEVRPSVKTHHTEVAEWVEITEIIAQIVLAIVGLAVGGITASALKVVFRVIIAVVAGAIPAIIAEILFKIPEWIAGDVPDALPPLDPFVADAVRSTNWSDSADFRLTHVQFNGGLQLGGDPSFPS